MAAENVELVRKAFQAFATGGWTPKRQLYGAIVRRLVRCEVPDDDILIVLHEPAMENWAVDGGTPASEVDVGLGIDI